jgi:hypothetical protein
MTAPRAHERRTGRRRRVLGVLTLAFALGVTMAACSAPSNGRPGTPATLQILTPAPNAVTGSTVDLRLRLRHAHVVPAAQVGGKIQPDRGHIHVSVDGQITAMYYGVHQEVPGLTPGRHTIQAEFVAADHAPFSNRVVAAVTFDVQ